MKTAIDIRETIHEKAGKGYYSAHLVREILNQDKANSYLLYTDEYSPIFKKFQNAEQKIVDKKGLKWHTSVLKYLYVENVDVYFSPTSYIIPAIHDPKKLKVVMTVHDLVAFLFPQKHNRKAVFTEKFTLKKALKKAAKVLSVSENTKTDLCSRFKCNEDLVEIVPNAACDIFEPIPREAYEDYLNAHEIPEKFIFSVGTLEPRKNLSTLIKSFARVVKANPDYHLLIAGKEGWMFEEIFKKVHELEIENNVKFLGYVPERDLVYLYNSARAFVYPSLYEGFGIPPLEALQSGCPVITSNLSALPEVVGDAAIKIDPKDENALTEAIFTLINNNELREELIKKGFKQAKKYSWKTSAQKFLDIIREL